MICWLTMYGLRLGCLIPLELLGKLNVLMKPELVVVFVASI